MANKMTKKDYFQILRNAYPEDAIDYEAVIAFIDHEIELLNRKSGSGKKPTATQKQNEVLKDTILSAMKPNRLYTVSELIKSVEALNDCTTQKVSPLMRQLASDGRVELLTEKRKTYYQKKGE